MASREHLRQDRRSSRHSDLFVSGVCVCFSASAASCWEPYLNRHTTRLHLPACIFLNLTVQTGITFHLQNPSHVFIIRVPHTHKIIRNPVESFFFLLLLRTVSEALCVCLWIKSMDLFLQLHLILNIFSFDSAKVFNPGLNINNSKQLRGTSWWKQIFGSLETD